MPNLRRAVALGAAAVAAAGAVVFASPAAGAADNAGPPGLPDCSATDSYDDNGGGVLSFLNSFANGEPTAPDLQAACPMARFLPPLTYGSDRDNRPWDTRHDSRADRADGDGRDGGSAHGAGPDAGRDRGQDAAADGTRDGGGTRDSDGLRRLFPFPDAPRFF